MTTPCEHKSGLTVQLSADTSEFRRAFLDAWGVKPKPRRLTKYRVALIRWGATLGLAVAMLGMAIWVAPPAKGEPIPDPATQVVGGPSRWPDGTCPPGFWAGDWLPGGGLYPDSADCIPWPADPRLLPIPTTSPVASVVEPVVVVPALTG